MNTNYKKYYGTSLKANQNIWLNACVQGNLELLKTLNEDPLVINKPHFIRFDKKTKSTSINQADVRAAISNNHISILKYLFTQKEYKYFYLKNKNISDLISHACVEKKPDILVYLMSLNNHNSNCLEINLHWSIVDNEFDLFKTIVLNDKLNEKTHYDNILFEAIQEDKGIFFSYLINNNKIFINDEIMSYLKGNNPSEIIYHNALKIISSIELYKDINQNMLNNNLKNKPKLKI